MVRNYKRTTNQASWSRSALVAAMKAVQVGGSSIRSACETHSIPFGTLYRHLQKNSKAKKLGRFSRVLSVDIENELVKYIKHMDSLLFGVTLKELSIMAFQLAEKNRIIHPFRKGSAGEGWVRGFLKRHPDISLRSPEPTSVARARGFNRPHVDRFFTLLSDILRKKKYLQITSIIWMKQA